MAIEPNERIKDLLPRDIFESVSRHLVRSGHRAEEGFPSGEEEEDSLSGDLLRAFRRPWSRSIESDGARWAWRVTTRKFRGRGELATEALIGADGIIQIEIGVRGGKETRKGILFQAKKSWMHRDQKLVEQVRAMETAAPGGSAVFDYGPREYRAASGMNVLESDARPPQVHFRRLGEFLADEFLGCSVGRRDTYYDWDAKGLVLAGEGPGLFRLYPQFLAAIQIDGAATT
jgi:hypothetical protein